MSDTIAVLIVLGGIFGGAGADAEAIALKPVTAAASTDQQSNRSDGLALSAMPDNSLDAHQRDSERLYLHRLCNEAIGSIAPEDTNQSGLRTADDPAKASQSVTAPRKPRAVRKWISSIAFKTLEFLVAGLFQAGRS